MNQQLSDLQFAVKQQEKIDALERHIDDILILLQKGKSHYILKFDDNEKVSCIVKKIITRRKRRIT